MRARFLAGLPWRLRGFVLIAVLWEVAAFAAGTPLVPHLTSITLGMDHLMVEDQAWYHVLVSATRVAGGLAVATVAGVLVGTAMASSRTVLQLLAPLTDVARSTAGLALYPLIIVFLGLGNVSKGFLVFWGAWPPVLLNTILGLTQVDSSVRDAARLDGGDTLRILRYVSFPLAAPTVVTGVRIGAGIGWIGLVAAEMVVGNNGIGYLILSQTEIFQFPEAYAAVALVALCGLVTHVLLGRCQQWISRRVES